MSKDNLVVDELPDEANLAANWEYRISLLEHNVAVLQGRVPKSKIRVLALNQRIVDCHAYRRGTAAIYGEDPCPLRSES